MLSHSDILSTYQTKGSSTMQIKFKKYRTPSYGSLGRGRVQITIESNHEQQLDKMVENLIAIGYEWSTVQDEDGLGFVTDFFMDSDDVSGFNNDYKWLKKYLTN